MDTLLDPASGLLNVPPGSATAKACQRDMDTIRAAVDRNAAGVTEAHVRLEMEHVLHTLDGGRMMEMAGDRIVATVMGLFQRASLVADTSSPWKNDGCEHGVCDEGAHRLTNDPVTTQGRIKYWIQELRGKANACRAVASAISADPSVQVGTPEEVAGGIAQDAHAFDSAATLIEELAAELASPVGRSLQCTDGAGAPAAVPAAFRAPLHLVNHIASLIAADLLGQSKEEDRQLVALRLVELLVRANAHPCCPPPADRTEVQERRHLGCAHCGTGIYYAGPMHQ